MECYENVELTFGELAQIALGAPKLTSVNTAVLHSLFDMILKKLNCQNEKVSITGFESMCMEEMYCQSNISPLPFNDENMNITLGRLDQLSQLEREIVTIETQLNQHLKDIQKKLDVRKDPIPPCHPIKYKYTMCEDLCTSCDPENQLACQLIQSTDFVKKLMRRMAVPMVERIFKLEEKIKTFEQELCCLLDRAEQEYAKVSLIDDLIDDVEALHQLFNDNTLKFLNTMDELQDILDAKMDKYHIPPLKRYIYDKILEYKDILTQMNTIENCKRAAAIVWERTPKTKARKRSKPPPKFCGCTGECLAASKELTLTQRIQATDIEQIAAMVEGKGCRKSCKLFSASARVMLVNVESGTYAASTEIKNVRRSRFEL